MTKANSSSLRKISSILLLWILLCNTSISTVLDTHYEVLFAKDAMKEVLEEQIKDENYEQSGKIEVIYKDDSYDDEKNNNDVDDEEDIYDEEDMYDEEDIWVLSYLGLLEYFDCYDILEETRPLYTLSTWKQLRKAYVNAVSPLKSTIGDPLADFDPFEVNYFVNETIDKGRGIFAGEFIPKGKVIYNTNRTAQFEDGQSLRKFLLSIPKDLVCDIMLWVYVDVDEHNNYGDKCTVENLRINLELSDAALCNHGEDNTHNTFYEKDGTAVANRDINVGEEILFDYEAFDIRNSWDLFGLDPSPFED